MFAAIHAIYSVVKANYSIDIFHTDEEFMPFTAWFFNFKSIVVQIIVC